VPLKGQSPRTGDVHAQHGVAAEFTWQVAPQCCAAQRQVAAHRRGQRVGSLYSSTWVRQKGRFAQRQRERQRSGSESGSAAAARAAAQRQRSGSAAAARAVARAAAQRQRQRQQRSASPHRPLPLSSVALSHCRHHRCVVVVAAGHFISPLFRHHFMCNV
jgi:hypothetical protein